MFALWNMAPADDCVGTDISMRRQDYELARDELFSSSYKTFNGSVKRFLEVCSKYEPARRALQQIEDCDVDYDEICESLERGEDPCPSEASQRIPFLYGLLREAITHGIDGASLLGNIISGVNSLDCGLTHYRRQFLQSLVAHIDERVYQSEGKRSSRHEKLGKAWWYIVAAIIGGFLTKFGEWLWRLIDE